MRKISTLLSLLIISIVVYAVPAKPGLWKTIKFSNGTEVRAQLVGDEFGHFWQGADGQTYVKLPNTDYYSIADVEAIKAKAQTRRQEANAHRMLRSPRNVVNSRRASSTGNKALILLVNFKDETFDSTHDNDLFQRITNEEGFSEGDFKGSMSDYFKDQSLGQFILEFDVIGPLTVSHNRSYYGGNDSSGSDEHPAEMVIEAVNLAKEQVTNWAQYDWDNDGEVDQVYVVYAGKGEADGGSDDTIWPHAWTLSSAKYYGDGTGSVTVATGLKVNTYACGSELNGSGKICGIGTMCHEFSHCLGYPDFYDTDYSGGQGMGYWDLMDSGSYNGNGYQPAGYTSYERWTAGWITPTVLEDENVTIEKMKALQETGESYVIYNKGHRDEFFLLENRQFIGWDASLPGDGLLILHCDYDKNVWAQNKPNDNTSRQRMTWIPADNKYQYTTYQGSKYYSFDGMENDPFPYGSVNSFSKNTTPAAEFYNKNSDDTYYMDSSVEDITQNNDGTVSFKFVANSTIVTPTDDYLFYESFDKCNGKGGNDGKWSGPIASAAFQPDYNGWNAPNAYGAYQCAKFGTTTTNGTATTPAFIVDGTATLTFKAGPWNANNDGTTLKLSASSGSITPESITMTKGAWGDYTATITATGNVKVTFAAEKGRFFLDEVLIVESDTELSATVVTAPTAKTLTYTGSAQELVDAGVASGGTMQYSLDGTTYDTKIPTGTNAGSYTVYYKVVGDASHSDTTPATVSVTIKKAPLTISGGTYMMKQGEELPAFTAIYTGFVNNETEDVLTTKPTLTTTATSASEPGDYAVTVSGAEAQNYEITYEAGTLTITEAEAEAITVTVKNASRKYGDANPVFEYEISGGTEEQLGGTPELTCEAVATSVVGKYAIKAAKGTATYPNIVFVNGTLTIKKAPLTISGGTYMMKQGEALPTFTPTYTGFKNDETEEALTTKPTLTTTATSASEPGEYAVTVSGAKAQNYVITYEAGTLTIGEADAITLTAQSHTIKYGDALPDFGFTSEGATLDGTPSITCEATSASPVGTYPIVITKGSVTNYNDHYVNGTLTIEKAPLTISGGTYTIKQGENLPTFTPTYTGFKNDETEDVLITKPTLTTEATSSSEPGEYEVTVSGAEAQNYAITYNAGTLTIVEADAVTLTAQSYTITYGDVLPEFDFTSEGAAVDGTPSITCEATSASPVGTYPIVITKGSVTNYNDHYVNGTLTIEKAPLTISGGTYTMKQGEELPAFTASYTGFKNDETEDVLITKPTLTTEATSSSEPGEYEVTVSGAEAQNYAITYEAGTLTITEASGICAPLNDKGEMINDNWYTLDGRKLQGKPTQKGVYIVNGAKVVIK